MAKRFSKKNRDKEVKVKYAKEQEGPKYTEEVVKLSSPQIIDDKDKLDRIKDELENKSSKQANINYNSQTNKRYDIKNEHKKEKKKMSKKKKVIITIAAILLVIIILISCAFGFVMTKIGKMNFEAISTDNGELGIQTVTVDELSKFRNIAILGVDARYAGYDTEFRTDCIIIASINKDTNDVKMFSIYRDTYVQMELNGETKLNKINQAYYNGVQNTIKTINTNLDLNIKEYVMADFSAVMSLVNAVGGIELDVTSEEVRWLNGYVDDIADVTGAERHKLSSSGTQKLDGIQAMAYCRIRYTSGSDFKRAERMRTVLSKVIEKVKRMNISELNSLSDKLLPELRTNISATEIIGLIPNLLKMDISQSFGWAYDTTSIYLDGDYYMPPITLESNVKKLHQEVYDQPDYEVPESIKEISKKIVDKTGLQ